jgi:DNA modification methylase
MAKQRTKTKTESTVRKNRLGSAKTEAIVAETASRYMLRLPFKEPQPVSVRAELLNVEETLSYLLKRDLTFKGEKTAYASHNLHAFAAKFPPQLPRLFIHELTQPRERVLDPMVGSGTTAVEAVLSGRIGIGIDLDPLSSLIAKVKTTPFNLPHCVKVGTTLLGKATKNLHQVTNGKMSRFYSSPAMEFFHYWFEEHIMNELFALVQEIRKVEEPEIRAFLQVIFSSCIITKTAGLTRARDLAHTRPHRDPNKQIKQSALKVFRTRLEAAIESLEDIVESPAPACTIRADARGLPLATNSVHLIVTSPPYAANAVDYMRAHKFSLIWFGFDPRTLTSLRRYYIGAEVRSPTLELASKTAQRIVQDLQRKDERRAAVVAYYFRDMEAMLREMLRVLMPGRAAVVVVGSSTIKGIEIEVPAVLAELAASVGFRVIGVTKREIVRDARMMPVSRYGARKGIEARMHEEGVVGLIKTAPGEANADA